MLGDHHRHLAVLLVGLVGRVDQLHAMAMVEVAGLLVVHVGQERQVRLRIHRRWRGLGLAPAARVRLDPRLGQGLDGFTAQCLELRVGDEEGLRRIQIDGAGVVLSSAQLAEQVAQLIQCLLGFVGHTERAIQGHLHADAFLADGGQCQALLAQHGLPLHTDPAFGRGTLQGLLPVVVEVTRQRVIRAQLVQPFGHLVGLDAIAVALLAVFVEFSARLGDVGAEPDHFAFDQHVEAVAIGQRHFGDHQHVTLADLFHHAHRQAGKGRGVERADVDLALTDEIVGTAAVEGLVRVGHEEVFGTPTGGSGQFWAAFEDGVELLAVVGGDVLHIAHVLVAALDLERAHAGIHQVGQVGGLVVVLHRQQVFLEGDHTALVVLEGVGQAAGLGTVATVGAAAGLGVGDVALAGEGHAQRAVDEELDGGVGLGGDGANLLQVQLTSQHQLGETGLVEEFCPLQGANVGLGTGMQLDRRDVQLHHAQVLDDQGVDTGVVQLMNQLARRFQLVVVEDGVDGGEDACMVATGELDQFGDLADFIAGVVARAEARAADVDGVSAVQDRLASNCDVTGRAEQFQVILWKGHIVMVSGGHGLGRHCSGEMGWWHL